MPARVPLRRDFDARHLRKLASRCKDARGRAAVCCLLRRSLRNATHEPWRVSPQWIGGMDRQTLRDWVHRFNEEGPGWPHQPQGRGPDALPERFVQMKELGEIVETGPDPAVDGVVRWRRIDLKRVIEARFRRHLFRARDIQTAWRTGL